MANVCRTCNNVADVEQGVKTCKRIEQQWKSLKRFSRNQVRGRKRDKVMESGGRNPRRGGGVQYVQKESLTCLPVPSVWMLYQRLLYVVCRGIRVQCIECLKLRQLNAICLILRQFVSPTSF